MWHVSICMPARQGCDRISCSLSDELRHTLLIAATSPISSAATLPMRCIASFQNDLVGLKLLFQSGMIVEPIRHGRAAIEKGCLAGHSLSTCRRSEGIAPAARFVSVAGTFLGFASFYAQEDSPPPFRRLPLLWPSRKTGPFFSSSSRPDGCAAGCRLPLQTKC